MNSFSQTSFSRDSGRGHSIVVGIVAGQPSAVVTSAAVFAQHFDAELVCASVDLSHYTLSESADGTVLAMPIDSDLAEEHIMEFAPELAESLAEALDPLGVRWSVRALAGGAAQELGRLADSLDASMIVVGTRERGLKGSLHEFLNGSVAVQLAHHQHRPVVVIPLHPWTAGDELSWQSDPKGHDVTTPEHQ